MAASIFSLKSTILEDAFRLWSSRNWNSGDVQFRDLVPGQFCPRAISSVTQTLAVALSSRYWYGRFIPRFWIQSNVEKALAARKFDLLHTDKSTDNLALFTEDEAVFTRNLRTGGIFKQILLSKEDLNVEKKALRWNHKVKKYRQKPLSYLVAKALFHIVGKKQMPQFLQHTLEGFHLSSKHAVILDQNPVLLESLADCIAADNFNRKQPIPQLLAAVAYPIMQQTGLVGTVLQATKHYMIWKVQSTISNTWQSIRESWQKMFSLGNTSPPLNPS